MYQTSPLTLCARLGPWRWQGPGNWPSEVVRGQLFNPIVDSVPRCGRLHTGPKRCKLDFVTFTNDHRLYVLERRNHIGFHARQLLVRGISNPRFLSQTVQARFTCRQVNSILDRYPTPRSSVPLLAETPPGRAVLKPGVCLPFFLILAGGSLPPP